jgi:hypothetical protein
MSYKIFKIKNLDINKKMWYNNSSIANKQRTQMNFIKSLLKGIILISIVIFSFSFYHYYTDLKVRKELKKEFRPDFVCFDKIIVELKAVDDFADEHFAQVYNYLKATGMSLGLLINFGKKSLDYKRIPCERKW